MPFHHQQSLNSDKSDLLIKLRVKWHSTAEQEAAATWPLRCHSNKGCVLRNGQVATASCSAVECHYVECHYLDGLPSAHFQLVLVLLRIPDSTSTFLD